MLAFFLPTKPKFKNANPYPVPSLAEIDAISPKDLAILALKRMTRVDVESKIYVDESKNVESEVSDEEETWIVTVQSAEQRELLSNHDQNVPIFIDGPFYVWMRSRIVNYFLLRTDPLDSYKKKVEKLKAIDQDDIKNLENIFANPFKKNDKIVEKPIISVHEQSDGTIYAICATGTCTKASLQAWIKLMEIRNPYLKSYPIVFRVKEKPPIEEQKKKEEATTKEEKKTEKEN